MSLSSHDRSEIAAVAGLAASSAQTAATERETLQQTISGLADCFGTDTPGQAFLSGYAPAARTALENYAQIATQLDAVADRLTSMGGAYAETEFANVQASGSGVDA